MKYYRNLIPFFCIALLTIACNGEDSNIIDFRDDFVGTYVCEKGSSTIDLEVSKDSDNENNLIIGPYSIPIDMNGSFGSEFINDDTIIELRFDGDMIFYREQKVLINGIIAPCVLEGVKKP